MSRGTRKQDKRRVKRQQRRRELRIATGGSPYQRIGGRGEPEACYLSRNWKDNGMGALFCLRRAPGGGYAFAAFLIDFWCMGLKDAWGRIDASSAEFRDVITRSRDNGDELVRVDYATAQRLLAGGIRFATQNGFRLPPRYDRWVALFGGVDGAAVDLSDFGVDGRLHYFGTMDDLQKRLVHGSAEEFLGRRDVRYVLGGGESLLLDEEEIEFEDGLAEVRARVVDGVREWCFAHSQLPHPMIGEAWDVICESLLQLPTSPASDELIDDAGGAQVRRFAELNGIEASLKIAEAMEQISAFSSSFDDFEDFLDHIGMSGNEDDET